MRRAATARASSARPRRRTGPLASHRGSGSARARRSACGAGSCREAGTSGSEVPSPARSAGAQSPPRTTTGAPRCPGGSCQQALVALRRCALAPVATGRGRVAVGQRRRRTRWGQGRRGRRRWRRSVRRSCRRGGRYQGRARQRRERCQRRPVACLERSEPSSSRAIASRASVASARRAPISSSNVVIVRSKNCTSAARGE